MPIYMHHCRLLDTDSSLWYVIAVAGPSSRVPSKPKGHTQVSRTAGGSSSDKPLGKPWNTGMGSLFLLHGSSPCRNRTGVSCIAGRFFTSWATREALEYWGGEPVPSPWIFPMQESNWGLLYCRQILYQLSYQGSPHKSNRAFNL